MTIETDDVLSILIHSDSKEGKSTLSSTAPRPGLVLDAEGSWKFIREIGYKSKVPLRVKKWNPLSEPVPRFDDTWDFCRVHVDSWLTIEQTYLALRQYEHDFCSIVLDSVTEIQRRCKENIRTGNPQMDQQRWGQLLDQMDALVRGFRDLTLLPNPVRCVVFNAETVMRDGKWRPQMQGQIRDNLPYWVDICGFLYTALEPNGDQQRKVKQLLIGAGVNPAYIAGERTQGRLPDTISNPNIADMLSAVFPNTSEPKE